MRVLLRFLMSTQVLAATCFVAGVKKLVESAYFLPQQGDLLVVSAIACFHRVRPFEATDNGVNQNFKINIQRDVFQVNQVVGKAF